MATLVYVFLALFPSIFLILRKTMSDLQNTIRCFEDISEQCSSKDDVRAALQKMEGLYSSACDHHSRNKRDRMTDAEICIEGNVGSIQACLEQGIHQALLALDVDKDYDIDALKCSAYSAVSACAMDTAEDLCGHEARVTVQREMTYIPKHIDEACSSRLSRQK